MNQQREDLEVDLYFTMHRSCLNVARWDIRKNNAAIYIFLPQVWDEALENSDDINDTDDTERTFVGALIFTYLIERICVERSRQNIRMHRNHCTPCCSAFIANRMFGYILDTWET